jgi:predicted acylesterase/phospholipase RssA
LHWSSAPGLFKFNNQFSMMSDAPMLKSFKSVFGEKTFADAKIPLYIMATDFETGESIARHEGKLVDALRASVAIPYIWSAWPHNGRMLIDGAASNPHSRRCGYYSGNGLRKSTAEPDQICQPLCFLHQQPDDK